MILGNVLFNKDRTILTKEIDGKRLRPDILLPRLRCKGVFITTKADVLSSLFRVSVLHNFQPG